MEIPWWVMIVAEMNVLSLATGSSYLAEICQPYWLDHSR